MSTTNRVVGMYTGMDTDELVVGMTMLAQTKVDNAYKDQQMVEWEQELYREVMTKTTDFQDTYFDVLNPENNITSPTFFSEYTINSTIGGVSSSEYIAIDANSDVTELDLQIDYISQLASKDTWNGEDSNLLGLRSTGFDVSDMQANGVSFDLSIDGNVEEITLDASLFSGATTDDDVISIINSEIQNQFGDEYSDVISKVNIDGTDTVEFDVKGSKVIILDNETGDLTNIGVTSGQSNQDNNSSEIGSFLGVTDAELANLTINGVTDFGITEDDDIFSAIEKINNSDAGVNIVYSSISDSFTMTSDDEGATNNIDLSNDDTVNFMSKLGITDTDTNREEGQNAIISINGQEIVKSSNNFTIDGIQYGLTGVYTGDDPIDVSIDVDEEAIAEKLVGFVDAYNELTSYIQGLVDENRDYDYVPLTSDEKAAMEEDEIESWEAATKVGILADDTALSSMLSSLRSSFYSTTEGAGTMLYEIGIDTSNDTSLDGQLEVDIDVLEAAIASDFSSIVSLFTSQSDEDYLDGDRALRNSENGIGQKIDDIFDDYMRSSRDANGDQGILVEMAGVVGESSEFTSSMYTELSDYDDLIEDLEDYLIEQEEKYYLLFGTMETNLQAMESSMSSVLSMLG